MSISKSVQTILDKVNSGGFVDDDDALTMEQWSELFGFGMKKTRKTIRRLIGAGLLQPLSTPIKDITGRKNYTYTYKPVGQQAVDDILKEMV